MRYACLRYFNACGAPEERGEDHTRRHISIPPILQGRAKCADFRHLWRRHPTPDGTCVRDPCIVIDLAQAHILALRALNDGSRTYNLGSGRGFAVKEVIDMAREVTGRLIPGRACRRPPPGDPAVLVASSDKIRREPG